MFSPLIYGILMILIQHLRGGTSLDKRILSWSGRFHLWFRLGLRVGVLFLLGFFVVKWLPELISFFMPFFLAFLLAWALNPLIRAINRKIGIPRKPLAMLLLLILYGLAIFVITRVILSIAGEVMVFAENWDTISASLLKYLTMFEEWVSSLSPAAGDQLQQVIDSLFLWLSELVSGILSNAGQYIGGAGSIIKRIPNFFVALVIFLMASYFMTADYPTIRFAMTKGLPENLRSFLSGIRSIFSAAFGGYVKAEFLLSIGVFIILLVGFLVIGQNYALLLAIGLAILDFIPIVGAGTIMVPWMVIDLINGRYQHALALLVIWGIIALFRRIGEPKVLGDQVGLHPIVSLFAIFLGMKVGGILGMIFGPVLVLTVLNIIRSGVFDGLLDDLKMAIDDMYAILKFRPNSIPLCDDSPQARDKPPRK